MVCRTGQVSSDRSVRRRPATSGRSLQEVAYFGKPNVGFALQARDCVEGRRFDIVGQAIFASHVSSRLHCARSGMDSRNRVAYTIIVCIFARLTRAAALTGRTLGPTRGNGGIDHCFSGFESRSWSRSRPCLPNEHAHVYVHLLPRLIPHGALRGGVAVVVDVLRATTVMVHALAAGCEAVIPCGEIDEARETAADLPEGTALLVGERQGLPIPGFDLGNSPGRLHPEVCEGKTLVMTTTNGTRAILASLEAERVYIASFGNLRVTSSELSVQFLKKDHQTSGPHHLRGNRRPYQPGG